MEAKTIVTRMARGSMLVLVGDPAQIDNPYVDRLSNDLVYTRDRLRDEACSSYVTLERGERSVLAEAVAWKMLGASFGRTFNFYRRFPILIN